MKIIEFDQFGGPDVLHVADRPAPAARDAQLVARVEARSVNAPDAGIREGLFADWTPQRTFPIVLGADFAGRVLRDSGSFTAGERVLGILPWFTDQNGRGSYAEMLAAESDWLTPLPDGLEAAAATTIPLNGLTAFQAAALLHPTPPHTVLLPPAPGGRRALGPGAAGGGPRPRAAARLPFAEAAGAHRLLAAHTAGRGRIVLL